MALGQDEEARVVDQQAQTAAALFVVPADPLIAGAQVTGRSGPGQQRQPAPAMSGDVTQRLADQRGGMQIVMLGEQRVEAGAFTGADGPDDELAQNQMLCVSGAAKTGESHARSQTEREKDIQSKDVSPLRASPLNVSKVRPWPHGGVIKSG